MTRRNLYNEGSENVSKSELKGLKLDQDDRENIAAYIRIYQQTYPPGMYRYSEDGDVEILALQDHLDLARSTTKLEARQITTKTKDDALVKRLSVPQTFAQGLQKAYPTIFSDEAQTNQFLRWFPGFDLTK